jgi:plasmid stabilization system protein ParE
MAGRRELYVRHEGFDKEFHVTGPFDNPAQAKAYIRRLSRKMEAKILAVTTLVTTDESGRVVKEEEFS